MNWYIKVLKNYVGFEGRARRKEYWFFFLFHITILVALSLTDMMLGAIDPTTGIGPLGAIYMLGTLIPSIAVAVRRLHDTSRSGWWVLISFVPIVGAIVFFVFMVFDSKQEKNQYGPNPKIA